MYLVFDFFKFALQSQEDLWLTDAQRLTAIIKQIIEFAKMVPGFMTRFNQEDQIVLLKRGKWHFLKVFEESFICSGVLSVHRWKITSKSKPELAFICIDA